MDRATIDVSASEAIKYIFQRNFDTAEEVHERKHFASDEGYLHFVKRAYESALLGDDSQQIKDASARLAIELELLRRMEIARNLFYGEVASLRSGITTSEQLLVITENCADIPNVKLSKLSVAKWSSKHTDTELPEWGYPQTSDKIDLYYVSIALGKSVAREGTNNEEHSNDASDDGLQRRDSEDGETGLGKVASEHLFMTLAFLVDLFATSKEGKKYIKGEEDPNRSEIANAIFEEAKKQSKQDELYGFGLDILSKRIARALNVKRKKLKSL